MMYKKGDMFANLVEKEGTILLHSCNKEGVWGGGIAWVFAKMFPKARDIYKSNNNSLGDGYAIPDTYNGMSFKIGCLIAGSINKTIPKDRIVQYTEHAIIELLKSCSTKKIVIHSPKINAGIFGVPWEKTEEAILKAIAMFPDKEIEWTVWEL